jgi:hypothetical protein
MEIEYGKFGNGIWKWNMENMEMEYGNGIWKMDGNRDANENGMQMEMK